MMELLPRANTSVCFFVGVPANALLCYLIARHSPEALRVYGRLLLQTVVVNTLFLCIAYALCPVIVSTEFGMMTYCVGPLAREGATGGARVWNSALQFIWIYMVWMSQFTVSTQFIYRYRALCHGSGLSFGSYLLLAVAIMLATGFFVPLLLLSGAHTALPPREIYSVAGIPPDTNIALAMVHLPGDTLGTLVYPLSIVLSFGVYALMSYYSVRIWWHLRSAFDDPNLPERTRQLATQINVILMVQAVLPFLFDFVPAMAVRGLIAIHYPNPYVMTYAQVMLNWTPVIDGLVIVAVVRPYRSAACKMLRLPCRMKNRIAPSDQGT